MTELKQESEKSVRSQLIDLTCEIFDLIGKIENEENSENEEKLMEKKLNFKELLFQLIKEKEKELNAESPEVSDENYVPYTACTNVVNNLSSITSKQFDVDLDLVLYEVFDGNDNKDSITEAYLDSQKR